MSDVVVGEGGFVVCTREEEKKSKVEVSLPRGGELMLMLPLLQVTGTFDPRGLRTPNTTSTNSDLATYGKRSPAAICEP